MRKVLKDFRIYIDSTKGHERLDNQYERGHITFEDYLHEIINLHYHQKKNGVIK